MKKLYVINLDNTRIMILILLLTALGAALFAGGLYSGKSQGLTFGGGNYPHNSYQKSASPAGQSNSTPQKGQNDLELPGEDIKLFSETVESGKVTFHSDPFLNKDSKKSASTATMSRTAPMGKYYSIQAAAYVHEKDAIRFSKELKAKGFEARVDRGIRFYFVRIGRAQNKQELELTNKKIQDTMKLESILVQLGS